MEKPTQITRCLSPDAFNEGLSLGCSASFAVTDATSFSPYRPPTSLSSRPWGYELIDNASLLKIINGDNNIQHCIVDARDSNIFNGWPDYETHIGGGHIRGASNFDSKWVAMAQRDPSADAKLRNHVLDFCVTNKDIIIIYEACVARSALVADYFRYHLALSNTIFLYEIKNWIEAGIPLESYLNYYRLVPPCWVYNKLYALSSGGSTSINNCSCSSSDCGKGKNSCNSSDSHLPKWKVFHTSWGEEKYEKCYITGHIKSAVYINTDEFEEQPLWSLKSDEKILEFVAANGINSTDRIILYSAGENIMSSFRTAILLISLGVCDVRVLNGGLGSWQRCHYPLETIRNPKFLDENTDIRRLAYMQMVPTNMANSSYCENSIESKKLWLQPQSLIVDINEARSATVEPRSSAQLVDIRSWNEHIGVSSGYYYSKAIGRPTGCIFGNSGAHSNEVKIYRNIDDTMKSGELIFRMWNRLGVDYKHKDLIFFCGSGWRASEVLFYSIVIGCPRPARIYFNGWFEWAARNKIDADRYKVDLSPPPTATATATTATSVTNMNARGRAIVPPRLFDMVTEGVYRSALPSASNVEFLATLGLKKIIFLSYSNTTPSSSPCTAYVDIDLLVQSSEECGARLIVVDTVAPDLITDDVVKRVLETIASMDNLPCLISCLQGDFLTGTVIACLRRLQKWSIASILEEYRRFVRPDSSPRPKISEQFIDLFDCDITSSIDRTHNKCYFF